MLYSNVPDDKVLNYENLVTFLNKTFQTNERGIKTIKYFTTGFSNHTYYIEFANEKIVLRKKPPGKLLPSAHQIEREFAIMSRLTELGPTLPAARRVPLPKPIVFCHDVSVLGTSFYIMEYKEGRIFSSVYDLYELLPWQRRNVYNSMSKVISAIHSYHADELKLPMYKEKQNYVSHNLAVWRRQYFSSVIKHTGNHDDEEDTDTRTVEEVRRWLVANMPAPSYRNTLIHGDCRIDSMIFDPVTFDVVAIIDWELSTIGDPLCDLANNTYVYYPLLAVDYPMKAMRTTFSKNRPEGIPDLQAFLRTYTNYMQINNKVAPDLTKFDYYVVFSCYKVASIVQGVYKRLSLGQASQNEKSRQLKDFPTEISKVALQICHKYDSSRLVLPVSVSALREEVRQLYTVAEHFIFSRVLPAEEAMDKWYKDPSTKWGLHPMHHTLVAEAKELGLWNLFLTEEEASLARTICSEVTDEDIVITKGLNNIEYAYIAELTGHGAYAPEIMNCAAPDTGNIGVLLMYGNREQQREWLPGLLSATTRSCFAMTEPEEASSDASNISASIEMKNDELVLNGKKWYITGGNDARCRICIFMGRSSPNATRHKQHSFVLVPMSTPGVKVVRAMPLFGYDHAPYGHARMEFTNVRVPVTSMLLGEGRGFEMAQGRLGPGRIHHCMRIIGATERALALMTSRAQSRVTFGEKLSSRSSVEQAVADSRIIIEQNRLLVLRTALSMDISGNKKAARDITMIKLAIGKSSQKILDYAIQIYGAAGVSDETPLAHLWAMCRILRLADGPDEVHARSLARFEYRHQGRRATSKL